MPELPEVETTRRGILPYVVGHRVTAVVVRDARLRWPVPPALPRELTGRAVLALERRAKYLIFTTAAGSMLLHLGMSGSLRVLLGPQPPGRHDHLDFVFDDAILRYTDPRRFGSVHWLHGEPLRHPLLAHLGPEPFAAAFSADYLFGLSRRRRVPVKSFLMDARVVVGVGNIYANEALHLAGIRPTRPAGEISRARYGRLVEAVRSVLEDAIQAGGTTLRDFVSGEGVPGYFSQQLRVYDRAGAGCPGCGAPIQRVRLGQRASYYCPRCQR